MGPADEPPLEVLVSEEGVRFAVQPARGQKTGFYAGAGLPADLFAVRCCASLQCTGQVQSQARGLLQRGSYPSAGA